MSARIIKLLFFTVALCALLAAATPVIEARTEPGTLSCANGKVSQCCNSLERYDPHKVLGIIFGLLNLTVEILEAVLSATDLVGLKCTPIDIGVLTPLTLSQKCQKEAVCCEGLDLHGIVTIGCVPIQIL
ncbi:hypothetical protein ONZ45_g997 [Pleurotus djamor]|nr:hypothetical protein ONZ45_g997 [Pleurotus djamor]